jgi:stalled ribosome rescue protein Dom34
LEKRLDSGIKLVRIVKRRRRYKRGYQLLLLVGIEDDRAVLWQVFSQVAKQYLTLKLPGMRSDRKALYRFHESIVGALRPTFREGVRSIVVTAPMKTTYAKDFLDHVRKHHSYLIQSESVSRTTFVELTGSADTPIDVAELVKNRRFRELMMKSTSAEADQILDLFEKHLSDSLITALFSLKEIEDVVYPRSQSNQLGTWYLLLTDEYLGREENRSRLNRLLQISKNRGIKTRIVNVETPAGERISRFGGIVFFKVPS